jgi:type I restriction enzyme S subunit
MYLTCALQDYAAGRGIAVSCPKPGPDILLERGRSRVWVEAVIATNGAPGLPDTLVEPNPDGSDRIPEEKIVLRYANAISEKYRKYREYLQNGIVRENDAFVIAVNGYDLSYRWTQAANDVPRFLKALYPLGAYQVLLDRRTGDIVGHQNEPRFKIVKASGANVAVMPFLERSSEGITAVLCSMANAMSHGAPLGTDFELAPNPVGRTPIPAFALPARRIWRAVLNESGGELTGHSMA